MLNKRPEDVTFADIESLVDTQQQEGYQLDYKVDLALPLKGEDKKEFLRDITSFANTYGGYLILGVEEDKGVPTGNIPGLAIDNYDRFKRDVETIIRDSIEPRLFAHTIREFRLKSGRYVIVIHISRSWNPPHRGLSDQFYNRHSAGKGPLSVEQLRRVFTQGADTTERVRRFIRERVFLAHSEEAPVPISRGTAKSVLHISPLASFEGREYLPISKDLERQLSDFRDFRYGCNYNSDGLFWYRLEPNRNNEQIGHYIQLFRSGIFENVENRSFKKIPKDGVEHRVIRARQIEEDICSSVISQIMVLRDIGIEPPIIISLSMIGVRGFGIYLSDPYTQRPTPIVSDVLFMPEVRLDSYEGIPQEYPSHFDHSSDAIKFLQPIASKLRIIFDTLWQSSGFSGSFSFKKGGWNPKQE